MGTILHSVLRKPTEPTKPLLCEKWDNLKEDEGGGRETGDLFLSPSMAWAPGPRRHSLPRSHAELRAAASHQALWLSLDA